MKLKTSILAVLAGSAALLAAPAFADGGHRHGHGYGHGHGHWKHHHKHHHHHYRHAPRVVVVPPAPVYYAPPPRVVYAPPPAVVYAPAPAVVYPAPVYRHAEPSISFRINVPL